MVTRRSENLSALLISDINQAVARLVDIWDSIGIVEDQRIIRLQTVRKHIEDLLKDMIAEEETLRQRIKTSISVTQKQIETLCMELSVEPYKVGEDLTVLQMEKNLRSRLECLQKEKSDRLTELSGLRKQDEGLCETLCLTPYYIPTGSLPSRTQLQELRDHIKQLSEEKDSRVKVFSGLRKEIRMLMDEMGHEPETSLECESVSPDMDVFLLTHENINALKLLLGQLETKRTLLLSTRDKLKNRAQIIWTRLNCPLEEAGEFEREAQKTLCDDIKMWQDTVDRLEVQQKSRLEEVVHKVREELVLLWEKCMFGPEQRGHFSAHFCDCNYTEELLRRHDLELQKTKDFYEKARPLLEGIEKWEKNWRLFLDFEKKAADPNRFCNRGGALLKESKDRAKVQKFLPKLEEDLRSRLEAWEKNHGFPFLMQGQEVMGYISQQWEQHRLQKDKEKNERLSKKADSTPVKTPSKRPHGAANSSVTPAKIKKTTSVSSSSSSVSSTFLCVPGKPPLSNKRTRPLEKSTAVQTPLQELQNAKVPVSVSYTDFTNELSRNTKLNAVLNSTVKDML